MRYPLMLLACCLTAWSEPSWSAGIDRVDIIAYGIAAGPIGVRDGTMSNGIEHQKTDHTRIVEVTTRIPACIGIRFGFAFWAVGAPGGGPVNVREFYRFPRSGLRLPGGAPPVHDSYFEGRLVPGGRYGVWYEFDRPWELVPGDWTIEIRDGNRVLASRIFAVVPPKRAQCPGLSV